MAIGHYGGKVTVPATADNLSNLLSLTLTGTSNPGRGYRVLLIRAATANAATVYFGPASTVTSAGANASGFLTAGDAVAVDNQAGGFAYTGNFYLVGNGSDIVYVDCHE